MARVPDKVGETEFGGVGGMIPPQHEGNESVIEQMWEVYATKPGDTFVGQTDESTPAADKVGDPDSYGDIGWDQQ